MSGLQPPMNVVVIVLDCARAKNFATSGGDTLARTPEIDGLAKRGSAFARAVAPSNWTLPSHVSIFSGRYPSEHGIISYIVPPALPETTAQVLHRLGYRTMLLSENPQLLQGYGLDAGFDVVRPKTSLDKPLSRLFGVHRERRSLVYSPSLNTVMGRIPPLLAPITWTTRAQTIRTKQALCTSGLVPEFDTQLGRVPADQPVYAFFNFLDTHEPYRLDSSDGRLGLLDRTYLYAPRAQLLLVPGLQDRIRWDVLRRGYIESIEQADAKVGQVLDVLRRRGRFERTLIIVTADHGQSFGEMGNAYHGTGATDSVTRVPLVVGAPSSLNLPQVVDRWLSLCEIHTWIVRTAEGRTPYGASSSETPDVGESSDESIVYAECAPIGDVNRSMRALGRDQTWNHRLIAAYRLDEKFVLDLQTNRLWQWKGRSDPDWTAPKITDADPDGPVGRDVYGAYQARSRLSMARSASEDSRAEIEIDRRLRSWGYD